MFKKKASNHIPWSGKYLNVPTGIPSVPGALSGDILLISSKTSASDIGTSSTVTQVCVSGHTTSSTPTELSSC